MRLSTELIQILKNFSSINQSLHFKAGKTLATISPSKTIMAKAKLEEEIEKPFAIYDLSRFLSTLSLFDQPVITIEDKFMTIKQDSRKVNYFFAEPSLILSPPDKEIKFPEPEVTFSLSSSSLNDLLKAQAVLALPEIAIVGEEGKCYVRAIDSKNSTGDNYSFEVGETEDTFKLIIKSENLKLLPADYDVEVSSKGLAHFKGSLVEYYIAIEQNSTFSK